MKELLIIFTGFSSSVLVAAGVFAFFIMIGVVSRLAVRTKTCKRAMLYEDMVVLGGAIGNLVSIYGTGLPVGRIGLVLFGLGAGIFTGCLAIALAEMVKAFPILIKRLKIKYGLTLFVVSFGLGKGLGALVQLLVFEK